MGVLKTISAFLKNKEYRGLLITSNIVLAIGAVVYHYVEGWSWLDSIYFCIITLTTIGYGDLAPQTVAGKVFTMAYILVGVGLILGFVNTVYRHYAENRYKKK